MCVYGVLALFIFFFYLFLIQHISHLPKCRVSFDVCSSSFHHFRLLLFASDHTIFLFFFLFIFFFASGSSSSCCPFFFLAFLSTLPHQLSSGAISLGHPLPQPTATLVHHHPDNSVFSCLCLRLLTSTYIHFGRHPDHPIFLIGLVEFNYFDKFAHNFSVINFQFYQLSKLRN